MSLMINDMDMPKNCWSCPMIQVLVGRRYCGKTLSGIKDSTVKLPDCPLIEIPTPHGRLIDADELTKHMRSYYPSIDHLCRSQHVVTKGDIDNAPTIIEAEVSE